MGLLVAFLVARPGAHPLARPFVGVGVLGGWTTFSALAIDVVQLGAADEVQVLIAYVTATFLVGTLAVGGGHRAAVDACGRARERRSTPCSSPSARPSAHRCATSPTTGSGSGSGAPRRPAPSSVNVAGSLVIGLIVGAGATGAPLALVGIGFCGALTTFSTLALEVWDALSDDRYPHAVANVALSLALGLGAAGLGWAMTSA